MKALNNTMACMVVAAWAAGLSGIFAGGAMAAAPQMPSEQPTVTAAGHAKLEIRPELLRVKLLVTAEGKDTRSALAALKQQRDDLRQKLVALGAAENSVKFGEPGKGTDGALTPQQRQVQMMMRMNQRGGNKPAATQQANVTVSTTCAADWTLGGSSADEAMIAADELQDKIKAALPNPAAAKKTLTPEEQELADEAASTAADNGGDASVPKPGEPNFVFVHKLTEEERTKLAADALAVATADAKRLAIAAGHTLGPVQQLSSSDTVPPEVDENPYAAYLRAMSQGAGGDAMEASGTQASIVSYSVQVSATFQLN